MGLYCEASKNKNLSDTNKTFVSLKGDFGYFIFMCISIKVEIKALIGSTYGCLSEGAMHKRDKLVTLMACHNYNRIVATKCTKNRISPNINSNINTSCERKQNLLDADK